MAATHEIEIEERRGEQRSEYWAQCTCGWASADYRARDDAVKHGDRHRNGEREPWEMDPSRPEAWGDDRL